MNEFAKHYAGMVVEDPAYELAFNLWARYYVTCEQYDRRVCSGRGHDGIAIPVTPSERGLCSIHAQQQAERTRDKARYMPRDTVERARRDAGRLSFAALKAHVDNTG